MLMRQIMEIKLTTENVAIATAVIAAVRREKAENRVPLNSPIKKLTIFAGNQGYARTILENSEDITGTCKVNTIEIKPEKGIGRPVVQYDTIQFVTEY